MKPVELAKDIFWIGAVDYNKRNFHGYSRSPRGTTYNSYLVRDEKNVVFDTVDNDYAGTMFCRLAKLMPLDKVDYIVVNHTEKDHAGALCQLVERCKPEKIITSTIGKRFMEAQFDTTGWPIEVVKTGDVINIGKQEHPFRGNPYATLARQHGFPTSPKTSSLSATTPSARTSPPPNVFRISTTAACWKRRSRNTTTISFCPSPRRSSRRLSLWLP